MYLLFSVTLFLKKNNLWVSILLFNSKVCVHMVYHCLVFMCSHHTRVTCYIKGVLYCSLNLRKTIPLVHVRTCSVEQQ